ncbi:MAG: hypothetical protein AB7I18_07820 [Candidatus Berkiella sp.]
MQKQWDPLKVFIVTILSLSSFGLVFMTLNAHGWHITYLQLLIFATTLTMVIYSYQSKKYFYTVLYLFLFFLYNPIIIYPFTTAAWKLLNVGVIILFLKNIFEIGYYDKMKKTIHVAQKLDAYLHEMEKKISHLTFHETATVINREYSKSFKMFNDRISWHDYELPDFEFYVLSSYFSRGKLKGGLSASGQNEFSNIEIHINFNLTHHVKYAVREEGNPLKTSLFGKQLKYMLIKKYDYVDMAKIIGI